LIFLWQVSLISRPIVGHTTENSCQKFCLASVDHNGFV
jgi:hypothetical protein